MTDDTPSRLGAIPLFRARAVLRRLGWRLAARTGLARPPAAPPPLPDGAPLRVGFIVCEDGKWGLSSLVSALQAMPGVDVGFYVTLSDLHLRMTRPARRRAHARQRAFFAETGSIWGDLYDSASDRMHGPGAINCDIAFVQQPWGMQDLPRRLSGRVRTAYVHYGMAVIANDRMQFALPDFHPWLWRHFLPTETHAEAVRTAPGPRPPQVRVTGHPKFDTYLTPRPERADAAAWPNAPDPGRKRVIFAPHHGLERGSLGLGTFRWSGPLMLDLARRHGQVDFLLRPHPNMEVALHRSGVMRAAEWQGYKAAWQALPNAALFEAGNYWEVFRTSDAMITDSGSFLAEYLPTGAPLIRLEQPGAAPLNAFGARLADGFYKARNCDELETLFADVILHGHDPKAQARAHAADLLMPTDRSAAERIAREIALSR